MTPQSLKELRAKFDAANWRESQDIREAELRAKPARDAFLAALEADTYAKQEDRLRKINQTSAARKANLERNIEKHRADMAARKPYRKPRKR